MIADCRYKNQKNMKMQYLFQLGILLQVYGMTPERAAALVPGVLGLVSVIVGGWALARSASHLRNERLRAIASLVTSVIAITLSGMHLARTASNSIGTGSGRLGAIVALVLGLIGIVLSGLALVRSRKSATSSDKEKS